MAGKRVTQNELRDDMRTLADIGVPKGEVTRMISNTANMKSMGQVKAAINALKRQYGGQSAPKMGRRY